MARAQAWSAELEAMLVRRLHHEWIQINWALFGDCMRAPIIELTDRTAVFGTWDREHRTIAISRRLVLAHPWTETLEVLKHEAAHQFVHEVLGSDEPPHGPHFQRVCRERGIDGRATGSPAPADARPARVVARVQKLLALAESANRHEAELAAATAQRIMLKHNLKVQRGDEHDDGCDHLWLGEPTGRLQPHQRHLASLLANHFFVDVIWVPVYRPREGKTGTILEVMGRPENLAMAEYVHQFVLRTVERLWVEHKRAEGIRSNRDRRSFLAGAVAGFSTKLAEGQRRHQVEGLVWTGDAAVRDYFRRRHPRTVSTARRGSGNLDAYRQGHQAGRGIVLSRPVSERAESTRERRALPPTR